MKLCVDRELIFGLYFVVPSCHICSDTARSLSSSSCPTVQQQSIPLLHTIQCHCSTILLFHPAIFAVTQPALCQAVHVPPYNSNLSLYCTPYSATVAPFCCFILPYLQSHSPLSVKQFMSHRTTAIYPFTAHHTVPL